MEPTPAAPSPKIPASQQEAQEMVLRYLQQTVDAMPRGAILDGRRLAVGDGVRYCEDDPSGPDAPVRFSDWRDVTVPNGTLSSEVVVQVGEVWRSWGWQVIERDGFPKPNRFGYGPDGYRLQIKVRSDEQQSLSLIGSSPCFSGSLRRDIPRNPLVITQGV